MWTNHSSYRPIMLHALLWLKTKTETATPIDTVAFYVKFFLNVPSRLLLCLVSISNESRNIFRLYLFKGCVAIVKDF